MLKCKCLYYIEIQVLSIVFFILNNFIWNSRSQVIGIVLYYIRVPFLHNNCGSFSYVSGTTAHKTSLSLVGNI